MIKSMPTLERAREIIRDYWDNGAEADLSHYRPGEYESSIVRACHVLEDEGTGFDMACVEHLVATAPGLFNYDVYGNWIGTVANENGWTP